MISNQILQNTVEGIKSISRADLCVTDVEGKVLVSTFPETEIGREAVVSFAQSQADSQMMKNYHFFKVYEEHMLEYILIIRGNNDDNYLIGKMATFQLQSLRLVFIVETDPDKNSGSLESIRSLFGPKSGDFITAVDEKSIIIVKEVEEDEDYAQMNNVAAAMIDAVGRDDEGKTHVAYGTIVRELKEVSRSYKEAKMAMDVGKIFSDETDIYAYSSLGIGRLIYQLPIPLCKMFIREIFGDKSPDDFDEETLTTINKFFENSLNVSETSRQLYIHRNTLVYRLDKLQKSTGLDLRIFEDAITFKIALMVVQYMKYMETLDY